MGDNTSTEVWEDSSKVLVLQELRKIQASASSFERAAEAMIQALEVSRPIGYPTSIPKGPIWLQELFKGHPDRIRNELGVRKHVFKQLIRELSAQGHGESEQVTLEEQLGIFLYVCTTGLQCRHVGERIDRSSDTVKKSFCKMLRAISSPPIRQKYEKLPRSDDSTPACIADDPIMYPFFKDAMGAIDGMHIMFAPTTGHRTYHNRRGFYSQYCLVCCNFNLEFTFVLSGWEGSASDERVYDDARVKYLPVPDGKYYLADTAFPVCPQLLLPYRSIQHNLPGREHDQTRPMNAHEYFNLRHAQLRSVVERAIYLLKQRFRILVVAPEADMDSQARIPSALCCIHNIIRRFDPEDVSAPAYARSTGKSKDKSSEACGSFAKYGFVTIAERDRMRENREKIASWLWKDRLGQYPRSQDYDV